jgi:hypothetical protein
VSGLTKDDRLIRVGSTDVEGMMTGADGSAHVAGKRYTTMEETQAERINRQALAEEQERVLGLIGGSDMLGMRAKMGGGVQRVSNYQHLGREGSASASLQRGAASALRLVTQLKAQFYHEIRLINGREREA